MPLTTDQQLLSEIRDLLRAPWRRVSGSNLVKIASAHDDDRELTVVAMASGG